MNLWKDILDSKFENQTVEGMELLARNLGYRFFSHKGTVYEVAAKFEGSCGHQSTGRTVDDCLAPDVWAVASPDEKTCAHIPGTSEPFLFASLQMAVAFANRHGGRVGPWYAIYHKLKGADTAEASRIIVLGGGVR